MSHFGNSFGFEEGSRLTGVLSQSRVESITVDPVITAHKILLEEGQDGDLETTFIAAFVPFLTAALHGNDVHGRQWMIVFQVLPLDFRKNKLSRQDGREILEKSLVRALEFNTSAQVVNDYWLPRKLLEVPYPERALGGVGVETWTPSELIYGLMAEMCGVSLQEIFDGYWRGCAFPDLEHECESDVFQDVFQRWTSRLQ